MDAVPQQQEMPFAIVQGEPHYQLPQDLYIPPDALAVFLDAFEGPLDLLLYLIRRQNIDILDIPVLEITRQYMEYIALMRENRFELAADYLVMAAMLGEIKSRMLLPSRDLGAGEEEDPRAELVRRLQEYERYRQAASDLDALPRLQRDLFQTHLDWDQPLPQVAYPDVLLSELWAAMGGLLARADLFAQHQIQQEPLSLRERMSRVLALLDSRHFVPFAACFDLSEGRAGVVVSFMAVLELLKQQLIELVQSEAFAPIHLRARA